MAQSTTDPIPIVETTISLGSVWSSVLEDPDSTARVAEHVEQMMTTLLDTLGVPARPVVTVQESSSISPDDDLVGMLELTVEGQTCRFSDDVLLRAFSYIDGTPVAATERLHELRAWLTDRAGEPPNENPNQRSSEMIALICREALSRQAGVLVTPAVAKHYADLLRLPDSIAGDRLLAILRRVVGLGVSISEQQTVRSIITGQPPDDHVNECVEQIVAALSPANIELRIEPGYLHQITTENATDGLDHFPFLRHGLFLELGLPLPDFRFVSDPTLKPGGFALTINHLTTLPWIGLPPDAILVNDTVDRLQLMGISGTSTSNPATMQPGSLVGPTQRGALEAVGMTTWAQLDYLILCVAAELRRSCGMLLNRTLTDAMLTRRRAAFPELEATARRELSCTDLTIVLRDLVADGVSIRNLRLILESLIESRVFGSDLSPDQHVVVARSALREQIAYAAARQTGTVVAYLVDSKIEADLKQMQARGTGDGPEKPDTELYATLRRVIIDEIHHLPRLALVPAILTQERIRPILSAMLRQEFPRLRVLAYDDLPSDTNVQPIARLAWSEG